MKQNDIIDTFLKLTSKTYPFGTEHFLEKMLPKGTKKDIFGNYFYVVGNKPRVIFTSHLDTVSGIYTDVNHKFSNSEMIVGTDKTTTLGADCKAGVTIMLNMINQGVDGLYYFFIGEEVGCVGSGKVANETRIFNPINYDKVISFDRRGNESIITHQSKFRSCSDEFAEAFIKEVKSKGIELEKDTKGVRTDSYEFIKTIPECTNISVGYNDEHKVEETQDLEFLVKMTKACCSVDWGKLPTKRDNFKEEKIETTTNTNTRPTYHDDIYGDEYGYCSVMNRNRNIPPQLPFGDDDEEEYEGCETDYNFNKLKKLENNPKIETLKALKPAYINDNFTIEEIDYIIDNFLDENDYEDKQLIHSLEHYQSIKMSGSY